jgi:ADP-heptose:LPS heptosyltransferase
VVHAWLGSERPEVARGLRAAGARDVRCHAVVRVDGPEHASTAYAAAAGVAGPLRAPALRVADAAPVAWRVPWEGRLVAHPGAGSPSKCWPREGFREVVERWTEGGGEVVVLLGPAEDGLRATWRATGHRLATDLDLLGTAALLASAPRYLGNDSGISHLAGALGLAGIVLFGPTRPERWRPLGGRLVPIAFETDAAAIAQLLTGTCLDTPTPRH